MKLYVDEEAVRGAAAIAANALYFRDSSDYYPSLWRIVRTLAPDAFKGLEDGTYNPDMLGDEPLWARDDPDHASEE